MQLLQLEVLEDEIGDVLEVEERTFERAPETMTAGFRDLVPGVFKLDGQLLLLLDAERVAAMNEKSQKK